MPDAVIVKNLPPLLSILSHLTPMRYAIDLARGIFYLGKPEYDKVVLLPPLTNIVIISGLFLILLISGTLLFVKNETDK